MSSVTRRGPGRPSGSDGVETRQRILHSAREVFSAKGFDRATLRQIAENAGLTRNALVNYYTSKAELYSAALASVHEVVIARILDDAGDTGPVHQKIIGIFERAIGTRKSDPTFVRFFVTSTADAIHNEELREQALLPIASVRDHIHGVLESAQRSGEIDGAIDTTATTQILVDLLWGLAIDIGFYSDDHRIRRTLHGLEHLVAAALT